MGLDVYLSSPGVPKGQYGLTEDLDADADPAHICKKNYLRSSYNGSGFNSIVGNLLGGRDLYWVFEPAGAGRDEYRLTPNKTQLRECRARAETLLADLTAAEPLGVMFERSTPLRPDLRQIKSEEDALALYREQVAEKAKWADSPIGQSGYANAFGSFYLGPDTIKVRAMIPGTGDLGPGLYLVYENEGMAWYVTAAKIVVEFIDYALSQKRPTIRWSA